MNRRLPVVLALSLVVFAVAPAAATPGAGAGPADQADDCTNGNRGPSGDAGPPGVVADTVPTFLGDLFADLPVPGFVTSAVGADPSC